jgi:hypothetical protein
MSGCCIILNNMLKDIPVMVESSTDHFNPLN